MTRVPSRRGATAAAPTRRLRKWVAATLLLLAAAVALYAAMASQIDVPPRSLGPYLKHRLSDHPQLAGAGEWLAHVLDHLDRGERRTPGRLALRVGAQHPSIQAVAPSATGRVVPVGSAEQVLQAIEQARPGDVITLEPGTYRFAERSIDVKQPGTADARIVLRASQPGLATLEFQITEGFVVSAPYWSFENLTIRGACAQHSQCEHAFHVVGGATHFVARNNLLVDFNAHVKINGHNRRFPDHGLIENNTLSNTSARQTDNPVTPIDLVAASHWIMRGNLIADFAKAQGNRISYGAFAKGGGAANRFEGNVVLCEYRLRDTSGWRVGLSLGGGGSGNAKDYCRDRACITEQDDGVIESNLIAACSDDGIYLNRAANSRIVHNTVLDTGGIVVRFAESSAEIEGNLVDGTIRTRDGSVMHASDNLQTGMLRLYFGSHPQRELYRDMPGLDLGWSTSPPRLSTRSSSSRDLCGASRPAQPAYGAFEDFSACLNGETGRFTPP